jgi:cAMP-binding proteins - catabolite gene activator and regulatory subunit of cAMP-dependent protein kinases
MKKYFDIIKRCTLFSDIENSNLESLLDCLRAVSRFYDKNAFVFSAGDKVSSVGIVLSGSVNVLQEDYWGSHTILAHIQAGGLFGEAFSCAEVESLPVSVAAAEKSEVLLIEYKRIATTCSSSCVFHTGLIKNMMKLLAQKNIMLTQKMEIITHRTTRERLLAYLSAQAIKLGQSRFTIPFNRQQLADYLSVERSAMSAELSHMQADGLIRTERSEFELLL